MAVLRMAGLRPTQQRIALAKLLFSSGPRHASAEQLHLEAKTAGMKVSLATVYNALHQFRSAGLLREISIDATRSYFDTDTSNHHHFFVEGEERVIDIPSNLIDVVGLPDPPKGMEISHVDIVVRVRPEKQKKQT
ncbi:MAG: transcriptional repressor [Devosiaceae bacterium]|nr:transcriptional repressor [Devosiaceae bacterium]